MTSVIIQEQIRRSVEVEVEFLKMGEIDNLNEKFTAEIIVKSKWLERAESDIIDYDIKKHWNPKLYIQNILSDPKEKTTYEIEKLSDCLRITENKIIKGIINIIFYFKCDVEIY